MAAEQRIIQFMGEVQGVGFRYTACRVAGRYEVVGYVKNMPDGSVECVVEGEKAEIDAFAAEVTEHMTSYIRRQTHQTAPASGRFHRFDVKF